MTSAKSKNHPKSVVQTSLSVHETENTITLGAASWDSNFRDRLNYERLKILTEAITAWRSNPIARRIIEITTEFVIGDGFSFTAPKNVEKTLRDFWNHPLNNLDEQLPEWADEAWRTGDLFLLLSIDPGGMVYVRALPSESIGDIVTAENDYRQELLYKRDSMDENPWPAYDSAADQSAFILHFPLNRAVGANFGESDLSSVLYWIKLYRQWLENRAQLNYFRQMFSYILQRPFGSQAEKESYMRNFSARIPRQSGIVLGIDPEETLSTLNPNLASSDAELDGLALKRMIASGVGMPLHYLAEPESSTRTTAESAGTPTFKRFKRRQQYLVNVVRTLLQTVIAIRAKTHPDLLHAHARNAASSRIAPHRRYESSMPDIDITTSDITERDNANLAIAVQRIVTAFAPLYNAKLIDPKEFIRLVYRFVAETMPETIGPFSPVNTRGGGSSKLPPKDPNEIPSDPSSEDPNNQ